MIFKKIKQQKETKNKKNAIKQKKNNAKLKIRMIKTEKMMNSFIMKILKIQKIIMIF